MRASLAASSASVGKLWDTGGVTPYFFGWVIAMLVVLILQSAAAAQGCENLPKGIDLIVELSYEHGGEGSKMLFVLEAFLWIEGCIGVSTAYWINMYVDDLVS